MKYFIDNKIRCIPVVQNQQDFLIGVFSIGTLLKFTKYTKRIIVGFDERNLPIYNSQIQRDIENSRVNKIADFLIEDPNATFPTNIVLHIPSNIIESQRVLEPNALLELKLKDLIFEEIRKSNQNEEEESGDVYITIIDGQHRIRGIEVALKRIEQNIKDASLTLRVGEQNKDIEEKLDKFVKRKTNLLNIQLVVSFFIDKALEYQAMIFSTINRTQKRVSDNLVSSLFGLNTEDSPQKIALQVVLALNGHDKSPFFNRVNLYGNSYDRYQSPPLAQATMVQSIVNLISENSREAERDRYRKRSELLSRAAGSKKSLPFRNYYATGKDSSISDIFFYFYTAVRNTFLNSHHKSYWDFNPENMSPSNVLQTSVGYFATLNVLVDILEEMPESDRYTTSSYEKYLKKAANVNVEDVDRYPLTSKSRSILYLDMSLAIWPPEGQNDERIVKLNKDLSDF